MTSTLAALADLHGRYDAVLCDIWGVLHDGHAAFPAAVAALTAFRAAGGRVVLVSNVPKPRDVIPDQLAKLGAPPSCWDAIVTSGDAIRNELAARAPGPVFKIGPEEFDSVLWEGLGLDEAPLSEAALVAISGLNDPLTETPADYLPLLQQAKTLGLDLYCANPDIVVRVGPKLYWCAGAVAAEYEKIGGRVIMAGKPHAPIYRLAYKEAGAAKNRLLAIGDGIATDVKGANAEGIDCLFIAAGIHGESLKTSGVLDAAKVAAALEKEAAHARYAMAALA